LNSFSYTHTKNERDNLKLNQDAWL